MAVLLLLWPTIQGNFPVIRGVEGSEAWPGLQEGYKGFTTMVPDRLGTIGVRGILGEGSRITFG